MYALSLRMYALFITTTSTHQICQTLTLLYPLQLPCFFIHHHSVNHYHYNKHIPNLSIPNPTLSSPTTLFLHPLPLQEAHTKFVERVNNFKQITKSLDEKSESMKKEIREMKTTIEESEQSTGVVGVCYPFGLLIDYSSITLLLLF